MKEDRISKVRRAGEEVNALVSNNQMREACNKTQQWYQEAKGHQYPPTSEQLYQTSTLRKNLYMHLPSEGESIPILIQPVSIDNRPPEVGEIAAAVGKLRSGRVGGTSGMKA